MRYEEDERQLAMASLEGHLRSNGNPDIHARKPCKRRLSERYLTEEGESARRQDRLRRHQPLTLQRHRTIKNMSTKNMSTEPTAATHINLELLTILQHAVGADAFGRGGGYRNHFVTGEGSKDWPLCRELVRMNLMTDHGARLLAGGDHFFTVTTQESPTTEKSHTKINLDQIEALAKAGTPGLCDPQTILALAERCKVAEEENALRNNILGRIANALFSDQDNVNDEDCVNGVKSLVVEREQLRKAHEMFNADIVELLARCQRGESTCIFTAQIIEQELEQLLNRCTRAEAALEAAQTRKNTEVSK